MSLAQRIAHMAPVNCTLPSGTYALPMLAAPFAPADPVYLVLSHYGDKIGSCINECRPEHCGWDSIIDQIAGGEWDDVRQVIQLAPGGVWRDVSELAKKAVKVRCAAEEWSVPSFCD